LRQMSPRHSQREMHPHQYPRPTAMTARPADTAGSASAPMGMMRVAVLMRQEIPPSAHSCAKVVGAVETRDLHIYGA
jgi:hypothetical protein